MSGLGRPEPRGAAWSGSHHCLDLRLVCALLQSLLKLILRGHIGRVIHMDLFTDRSAPELFSNL